LCHLFDLPTAQAQQAFGELWHRGYKMPNDFSRAGAYQAVGQAFRNAGLSLAQADALVYYIRITNLD